jgi:hypothetical protein
MAPVQSGDAILADRVIPIQVACPDVAEDRSSAWVPCQHASMRGPHPGDDTTVDGCTNAGPIVSLSQRDRQTSCHIDTGIGLRLLRWALSRAILAM